MLFTSMDQHQWGYIAIHICMKLLHVGFKLASTMNMIMIMIMGFWLPLVIRTRCTSTLLPYYVPPNIQNRKKKYETPFTLGVLSNHIINEGRAHLFRLYINTRIYNPHQFVKFQNDIMYYLYIYHVLTNISHSSHLAEQMTIAVVIICTRILRHLKPNKSQEWEQVEKIIRMGTR